MTDIEILANLDNLRKSFYKAKTGSADFDGSENVEIEASVDSSLFAFEYDNDGDIMPIE